MRPGETWDEDRGRVILNAGFDFKRLSDDETMAIFEMDEAAEEYHSEMRGGLRFFQAGINIDLEKPIHNIIIRHDLTDGPLPGPSIDLDKFELSVDWKAMLTPFYSEIFLTTKTNREFVASSEERMAGIKAQLEAGHLDMMTVMLQAMQEFGDSNDRGLKRGRRARIIKQYREGITQQPNFTAQDLDEDLEKEVLLSLAKARQFLGFCDDEDDESEEEDDEDEEGDSEEDEWEDDDGEDEDENADSDVE